jgi:hypothetical protein
VAGLCDVLRIFADVAALPQELANAIFLGPNKSMRFCFVLALSLSLLILPARAVELDRAYAQAIEMFERASAALPNTVDGVVVEEYLAALNNGRFTSAHWGGVVSVTSHRAASSEGACARFAAYVLTPPQQGEIALHLCPQFFQKGADALRRLTILHEMVHVVAGPDECRAMAFAARVEYLATGGFTPVDIYWRANKCPKSRFSLPN